MNSDKKEAVEGWMTTIFCPTVLNKKCHFPVYFYTYLPIHLIEETAFFSIRICKGS